MSYFQDTAGCTLPNNHTLHHPDKLSSGRPFMSTCVPRGIRLDLTDIEVVHAIDWQHNGYNKLPEGSPNFKVASRILAKGKFKDRLTVFRVPEGSVGTFRTIDVQIKPLPKGQVGGKQKATTMDGVAYSGMTSSDVPEGGLMAGEPGSLLYIDPTKDEWPSDHTEPYLELEGFMDEAEFSALVHRMSLTSAPVRAASLYMVAELFQHEVDASLSEPYHPHDFGMLLRPDDKAYGTTRARAEHLSIAYRLESVPEEPDYYDDLVDKEKAAEAATKSPEVASRDSLIRIEKQLKTISKLLGAALGIGIAAFLFLR
jgi:hypothetical protein